MGHRIFYLPVLLLSLTATNLRAQAKFAIYGTGGGEKPGIVNEGWTTAETFGFYYGLYHVSPLALSADVRAELSSSIKSGLIGPRVAFHIPAVPLKPYAEALIGGSTYPTLPSGITIPNKLTGRIVGGIDTAILPHIDWRMIDYSYGLNKSEHTQTITSGLVLRF
jgi:hypothetical protein